jgi:alanine dehydrogenase
MRLVSVPAIARSVFYCVANMPGAVPHTSTQALTNAILPYVLRLASQGCRAALAADPVLTAGLSTHDGQLTSEPVARDPGLPHTPPGQLAA